jgi:hypothetical protein
MRSLLGNASGYFTASTRTAAALSKEPTQISRISQISQVTNTDYSDFTDFARERVSAPRGEAARRHGR